MFKKILAIAALSIGVMASAVASDSTVVDTNGLTDAQKAELKSVAAKMVADQAKAATGVDLSSATKDPSATMTLAATWGQQASAAAEGFSHAFTVAAKELGITVNDFLHTDAGKLTAALIIWKVAGASVIHMMYGLVVLVIGLTMVRVLYKRLFAKEFKEVQYSRFGGLFKGTKLIRIPKSISDLQTDGDWLAFWIMIIITLVTVIVAGTFF